MVLFGGARDLKGMSSKGGLGGGGGGRGRLTFFLPGCVSMWLENRPILKGFNNDNLNPY